MRITFYRCDRPWASIISENVSYVRVAASAPVRRGLEVRNKFFFFHTRKIKYLKYCVFFKKTKTSIVQSRNFVELLKQLTNNISAESVY